MIHFVVPADQEFGMRDYLSLWGSSLADRVRILHYESLPVLSHLNSGTYILAALDQLRPPMLGLVQQLHQRLSGVDGFRILNHPTRTLRRYDLLTELRRMNRNEFGAVRATENAGELRFPVFVRAESSHTGALSPLLHSASEVEAAIGRALIQGYQLRDLLVVEFCDTVDANGYYRKYAAFAVGNRVIARSLSYGRRWLLKHAGIEFSRAMVAEELEYVQQNPHESELAEIFEIAGVGYGRIDYAIKNNRVQTWEINLNPTIGRGQRPSSSRIPAELAPLREEVKQCFYSRFQSAMEHLDFSTPRSAIHISYDERMVRAAASGKNRNGRFLGVMRHVLAPIKPLLVPLGSRMLPWAGRLARHYGRRHKPK